MNAGFEELPSPAEPAPKRQVRGHKKVLFLAVVWLALVLWMAWSRGFTGWPAPSSDSTGQPTASDFSVTTFDGRPARLADFKGQVVVLNFWASWCLPCRAEMPAFEKTYRAYKHRGVVFIGLAVQDDPEASQAFLRELDITYPNAPDTDDSINQRYGLLGLPMTVFINQEGKIAHQRVGELDQDQLTTVLEELLGE